MIMQTDATLSGQITVGAAKERLGLSELTKSDKSRSTKTHRPCTLTDRAVQPKSRSPDIVCSFPALP